MKGKSIPRKMTRFPIQLVSVRMRGLGFVVALTSLVGVIPAPVPASADATATATIGSISTGTRPGAEVGRNVATLPTLRYCVTYTSGDQARDYGYEVLDAAGVRPPFGSAFTRQFEFVPGPDWTAGGRLAPKTLCNTVTLEPGRTYTVRAWITSGPFDTRGSWSLTPASAPTAATFDHSTVSGSTTTTTTAPSRPSSSGESDSTTTVTCPPTSPIRTVVNGSPVCVPVDIFCRSNPGWSDAKLGVTCPRNPVSPGQGSDGSGANGMPSCSAVTTPARAGRTSLRLTTTGALARQRVQVEVQSARRWYRLGTARITKSGVAIVSTDSRILNPRNSYRLRATQGSRVVCAGTLTIPTRLNLRGAATPA